MTVILLCKGTQTDHRPNIPEVSDPSQIAVSVEEAILFQEEMREQGNDFAFVLSSMAAAQNRLAEQYQRPQLVG